MHVHPNNRAVVNLVCVSELKHFYKERDSHSSGFAVLCTLMMELYDHVYFHQWYFITSSPHFIPLAKAFSVLLLYVLLFLCQHILMSYFNSISPDFPIALLLYMLVFPRVANSSIYSPNLELFMKDHTE